MCFQLSLFLLLFFLLCSMVSTSYRGCEIFSVALSLKKYDSSQFKVHLIHRLTVLSHTLRCANFFLYHAQINYAHNFFSGASFVSHDLLVLEKCFTESIRRIFVITENSRFFCYSSSLRNLDFAKIKENHRVSWQSNVKLQVLKLLNLAIHLQTDSFFKTMQLSCTEYLPTILTPVFPYHNLY